MAGRRVRWWLRSPDQVRAIQSTGCNALVLPDVPLSPQITVSASLDQVATAPVLLAVVPAQALRGVLTQVQPLCAPGTVVVLCAKGVEQWTLALMTEVLAQTVPQARPAVLSGPGFAKDVAKGLPTATTVACADPLLGSQLVATLGLPTFRPYLTDDLIGTEIGGAVKNVLAIACGISEGRGLGEGARAALITRGFAEMCRLGVAMGARLETLNGLCGLGDLVLTCVSRSSRNTALGVALGQGISLREALSAGRGVAEGAATAPAVVGLAQRHGVDMPISQAVAGVLDGSLLVDDAMRQLLSRPFRAEGV
jgi:glycerol-3-phosphate dehydrogenase (NAD(P)+)